MHAGEGRGGQKAHTMAARLGMRPIEQGRLLGVPQDRGRDERRCRRIRAPLDRRGDEAVSRTARPASSQAQSQSGPRLGIFAGLELARRPQTARPDWGRSLEGAGFPWGRSGHGKEVPAERDTVPGQAYTRRWPPFPGAPWPWQPAHIGAGARDQSLFNRWHAETSARGCRSTCYAEEQRNPFQLQCLLKNEGLTASLGDRRG